MLLVISYQFITYQLSDFIGAIQIDMIWSAYTPKNHIAARVAAANRAMTAAATITAPTAMRPMAHTGKPATAVDVGLPV